MAQNLLTQILILLTASVLAVAVFRRLKLPPILGYLAVGIAVGPHSFGLLPESEGTRYLAEFGVVFLLFTLGLEFSLSKMLAMKRIVLGLGGAQVLLTTIVAIAGAWALGVPAEAAVVIGGAVAMSSTAIVATQLGEQLELNTTHGRFSIGILLFQDLAFVPFLVLMPALATGGDALVFADIGVALLQGILVLISVLAAGKWLLRPLFHEIAHGRTRELFMLAALLVALSAAWATHAAGMSFALGAFLAGMMLGETEYRHQVESDIRPFRDILLGLFFITIGMLFNINLLVQEVWTVLAILLGLVLFKTTMITVLARMFCDNWRAPLQTGIALAQGGEFGFALLTLALTNNIIAAETAQQVLAAIVLSMAFSPLLIRHNIAIANAVFGGKKKAVSELTLEDQATISLAKREHVIICGYGRVGQNLARVLEEDGFEYLALDLDPARVRKARQAGDSVIFGDANDADVLQNVGVEHASVVVITSPEIDIAKSILETVKGLRPDVPVLVRTMDDTLLDDLQDAGATEVVPFNLEGSLMLLSHVLLILGEPVSKVVRKIGDIRGHRYRLMRNIFRKEDARPLDESHAFREQLQTVALLPEAEAVGKTIADLKLDEAEVLVTAIRRDGIVGRQPVPETILKEGDVLVLYGTPEALEHAENLLLVG